MPRHRCGVVGSPIAHSLSPVLHRAAYDVLGLTDWEYDAREVREQDLPAHLDGLDRTWRGLSLTMPLKRAVVPLLDDVDERAAQAWAANTLVLREGRREGHNTDVPGAAAAVRERFDGPVGRAVIVGGGATASSTLLALADLGCRQVTLMVRDESRAAATVATAGRHPQRPDVEVLTLGSAGAPPADVLVSTIPAVAQRPDVLDIVDDVAVVFEVLYDPWPTPLAHAATERGRTLVGGLDLLVHQAVLQVELMTGADPSARHELLAAMRSAGERALADRSSTADIEAPAPGGSGH